MRSMIGMALACGLVAATASNAAAQGISFDGWAADGRAVISVDDPFDALGSGQDQFQAVCVAIPIDGISVNAGCAMCSDDYCRVATKPKRASTKSPDRKVSVSNKRACTKGADGKVCTQTVTVGKLGKFVHNEGPAYMNAKVQVYFRADSKAVVILVKASNPESGSGEDGIYVVDLAPEPPPEYDEPVWGDDDSDQW